MQKSFCPRLFLGQKKGLENKGCKIMSLYYLALLKNDLPYLLINWRCLDGLLLFSAGRHLPSKPEYSLRLSNCPCM